MVEAVSQAEVSPKSSAYKFLVGARLGVPFARLIAAGASYPWPGLAIAMYSGCSGSTAPSVDPFSVGSGRQRHCVSVSFADSVIAYRSSAGVLEVSHTPNWGPFTGIK